MNRQAHYFRIGVFVIAAMALALAGLMLLGLREMGQPRVFLETYINESVQGLDIGSPVKHRGVKIGEVASIDFVDNVYPTKHRYVLVRVSAPMNKEHLRHERNLRATVEEDVKDGLRVRLASQGVTGLAYLESDYYDPLKYPPLEIDWKPEFIYVPSAPSRITVIVNSLENIFNRLQDTDFERTVNNVNVLITNVNVLVAGLSPIIRNLDRMPSIIATNVEHLSVSLDETFNHEVRPALANVRQASAELPETISRLNRTAAQIEVLLENEGADMAATLENLNQASRDLKQITGDAKQYPARLFFSEPPPRIK